MRAMYGAIWRVTSREQVHLSPACDGRLGARRRADPVTGTFQVRVGLSGPPPAMRLGSTVTGRIEVGMAPGYDLPATAVTRAEGLPAVWVVDPQTQTVSLRTVEILRFDPTRVVVAEGLGEGDLVVTAGVQALRPGQKVRLLGTAP